MFKTLMTLARGHAGAAGEELADCKQRRFLLAAPPYPDIGHDTRPPNVVILLHRTIRSVPC